MYVSQKCIMTLNVIIDRRPASAWTGKLTTLMTENENINGYKSSLAVDFADGRPIGSHVTGLVARNYRANNRKGKHRWAGEPRHLTRGRT